MRLPVSIAVPAGTFQSSPILHNASYKGGDTGSQLRQWSSIIGIVTAIVGNILISFALNIQRYAHIRLEREYNSARDTSPRRSKRIRRDYGTAAAEQEQIAEERARLNADAPGPGYSQNGNGKASQNREDSGDENTPLKHSLESGARLKGSEKSPGNDDDERKSYLKSPYWWTGIILMTVGEAGNFLAYGFAPASIVSPLGVVALISNCIIAPFMLKERFRQRDFWGVFVAVGGVVTVVLSAKQSETKLGPDELWATIKRWEFLLYVVITLVAIIVLMIASPKYGSRSILVNLGLVGLFGGYTALSTKGVASLLSDSLVRAFTFPIFYFLLVILASSAVMQIRYLNRALQDFNSTQVIPTQFVLFTLSVIIGSAVLYRDFEAADAERVGKFVGGCLLTFFGVYLITSGRQQHDDGEDDSSIDDEEEGIHLIDEEAEAVDEQTPLQDRPILQIERPLTPEQSTQRALSVASSSSTPSIAITPEPAASSTSLHPPRSEFPWLKSANLLEESPSSSSPAVKSQPDLFKTPQLARLRSENDSTPYYTPSSQPQTLAATAPRLQRSDTGPADPETPTKKQKRSASPPKPDLSLRVPPSPNTSSIARSARGSIGRLLPGPLMNPLSSSLSAVVAESLLRGEGSPRQIRATLRRNRSERPPGRSSPSVNGTPTPGELRRRSANLDDHLARVQTDRTEPDTDVERIVEGDESVGRKKSRLRAMSDGIEGLLRRVGSSSNSKRGDEEGEGLSRQMLINTPAAAEQRLA